MPRPRIVGVRFRPPVAIARLGDSPSPLDAYTWAEDARIAGAGKTVIVPQVSLEVLADGSIEPYLPGSIRFRDGRAIRPVCPFLELEAKVKRGSKEEDAQFEPLTAGLLKDADLKLAQISFQVVAANLKAQRRTGDKACAFEARVLVVANDHSRHELRAWSHAQTGDLLVLPERPILLGAFQVIRPVQRSCRFKVGLDTIRVRFTPGRGEVYGPRSRLYRKPATHGAPTSSFVRRIGS